MKFKAILSFVISAVVVLVGCSRASAAPPIHISGESGAVVPVAITGFSGEVADVLQFDLYVQGFKIVSPDQAQFLISGSNAGNVQGRVTLAFAGKVEVGGQTKTGTAPSGLKETLLSKSYTGGTMRRQAHAFADDIVQATTGRKGIGQTRIAFKMEKGENGEVYIADFDGGNAQAVTHDNAIVAGPAWVPGRLALCYTSYRLGSPGIFLHNLSAGQRTGIARYAGSNISPAPSPDGSKLAWISSQSGAVELWVSNLDGSGAKQLTRSKDDESSPCWSPDGRWICYATRLEERRFLYKISPSGGPAQRITTAGISNPSEPDWSPDGKTIVFTAQMGSFQLCVVPAAGGSAEVLMEGEDASWAPNSRTVIYVRRQGNRRSLSMLDVPTKQTKDVSRISGSNSQPSWAK